VIVDAGAAGLVFIEVKYLSGNDEKPKDYSGWERYVEPNAFFRNEDTARLSGCYELTRNWYLLNAIADGRPATLVNLGPDQLFAGSEGERLARFENALATDAAHRFVKLTWPQLLRFVRNSPHWFNRFCLNRQLLE
jgi:hypothetical protein